MCQKILIYVFYEKYATAEKFGLLKIKYEIKSRRVL